MKVKETGKTFEENAVKKAKAVSRADGGIAIADDSGLEVKCLNGRPGVRSARFAGPKPTSQKLCKKLLKVMKNCKDRSAQFVCVIAVVYPDGRTKTIRGVCKGKIIDEMRGKNGFGYDPVFVPRGYRKTFAEMKPSMKNKLSHRGKALRKLIKIF
jgi:XTP/dITP diphosphohydrolase